MTAIAIHNKQMLFGAKKLTQTDPLGLNPNECDLFRKQYLMGQVRLGLF